MLLDDGSGDPRARIAACLVLLFAQPVSRVVRLTTDDVLRHDTDVLLRLGDPPSSVPEPVATLLLDYITALPDRTAAVNAESRWLFPGRRANQPIYPASLRDGLRGPGVPLQRARTSSIRHLVLQAPAPVIAKAPGYHALLDRVRAGAALAIADYPRHWDEANLTNHLARPLIAASTGHDVPQPLAGDLAVSREVLTDVVRAAAAGTILGQRGRGAPVAVLRGITYTASDDGVAAILHQQS